MGGERWKIFGDESGNKKPSGRSRRVFERANGLGVLADAAERRETGQAQAHQQGAGGFGNNGYIVHKHSVVVLIRSIGSVPCVEV